MQINIVSEPKRDPTSEKHAPRWLACVYIKTAKKLFADHLLWQSKCSYESEMEAEEIGYERLAIGLFGSMK